MKTAYGDPALDGLAAILLRDSCGCAECRDFSSGQRLGSITDLANPTSNALYQRLGYQPVEDRVVLRFGA